MRRRWPATLVSWSRLLAGDFRDPLVGRDVLVGCFLAPFSAALGGLVWVVFSWLGYPPPEPSASSPWLFLGERMIAADLAISLIWALFFWLAALFVLLLLRALLRNKWAAALAWVLFFTVFATTHNQVDLVSVVVDLLFLGLAVFVLIRFGLLALVANGVVYFILHNFPLTTQGSVWYAGISLSGILLIAAVALYAFYTSLGGRPVFGGAVLEE